MRPPQRSVSAKMRDLSYYSTAAQVLPVLLLALVVQTRIWPSPLDDDVGDLQSSVAARREEFARSGRELRDLSPESHLLQSAKRSRNVARLGSIGSIAVLLFGE